MTVPTRAEVLKRYKRFKADADPEHKRVLAEASEFYQAYGGNSIQGSDFADLETVWGKYPPEAAIIFSAVNTFWGSLIGSRREPTFPGFDQGLADEVVGEFMTMLVKAGRRWAGSDTVDEGALMDLIVCGVGFAQIELETEERPPFRPRERHIALDRVWWDPGHRQQNMKDAQELAVMHPYGVDEAAARFPDYADIINAMREDGSGSKQDAPAAGARALGGPAVSVSVSAADGSDTSAGDAGRKRLREVQVFDFQFVHFEELISWQAPGPDGQPVKMENTVEAYDEWAKAMGKASQAAGQPFQPPPTLPYCSATWYRCRILGKNMDGDPLVLTDPEPIPGNQRLVRCMTAQGEYVMDGERLKRRWFGWGRILLPLQRLVSVAIRIEIEQEARRNRGSAFVEDSAFGGSQVEFQKYVQSRRIPGSVFRGSPGDWEKIHEVPENVGTRVASMKEMFEFFAKTLPEYVLGISDMNRGTFSADRSVKMIDTMLQASSQMQTAFTSAFTAYLDEGAVTMARLLLGPQGLDAEDIDKILGATGQKLREGITGQVNPESGELEPIMVEDETGEPVPDQETGELQLPQVPMTAGRYLKANMGEIFDHDIAFGLRPAAASERAANAQLWSQHGVLETMLANVPDPGKRFVMQAYLTASYAEGTPFADLSTALDKVYDQLERQQEEAAKAASEEGWVQFIQQLAGTDQEKAFQLMQQASDALMGPGGQGAPQGQQGGGGAPAGADGKRPPSETINFKDLPPEGQAQMAAQAGIQLDPAAVLAAELRKAELKESVRTAVLPSPPDVPQGG